MRVSFPPEVGRHVRICKSDGGALPDGDGRSTLLVLEVEQGDDKRWNQALVRPVDEPGDPFWISRRDLHGTGRALRPARPRKRVETHGLDGRLPLTFRRAPNEETVNVLLVSEDFIGTTDATRFVARFLIDELRTCHKTLPDGAEGSVWTGTRDHHPKRLIFWVGVSAIAPPSLLDSLADIIDATGCETARGKAVPERHGLTPLLHLGEEALELLSMF